MRLLDSLAAAEDWARREKVGGSPYVYHIRTLFASPSAPTGSAMSSFTPDAGTLFYAEVIAPALKGDRSFSDNVLRCLAVDQRTVVAAVAIGFSYSKKPVMLLRHEYRFTPVGPEVAKALGISDE